MTTLAADGTLGTRDGARTETGMWSYSPWQFTSAKDDMPAGEADECVLWLRIGAAPTSNLVYFPLTVSRQTLVLSFVGRGNTIVWVRR